MDKMKIWKKIKKSNYKDIKHLLNDLTNKGYILRRPLSSVAGVSHERYV